MRCNYKQMKEQEAFFSLMLMTTMRMKCENEQPSAKHFNRKMRWKWHVRCKDTEDDKRDE